jgi:hypothetical protein
MGALSAVLLFLPAAASRKHLRRGTGFGCAVVVDAVIGNARVGWALDVAPLLEARVFEAALRDTPSMEARALEAALMDMPSTEERTIECGIVVTVKQSSVMKPSQDTIARIEQKCD